MWQKQSEALFFVHKGNSELRKQWNDLPLTGEDTHGFICWNKWKRRDELWCKMCVQRQDLCCTGVLDTLMFGLWSGCSTLSQMSCPGHAQRSWIWFVLTSLQSCRGWNCHSKYKPVILISVGMMWKKRYNLMLARRNRCYKHFVSFKMKNDVICLLAWLFSAWPSLFRHLKHLTMEKS